MRHNNYKLLIILGLLTLSYVYPVQAGDYYDPEGVQIVKILRNEFPVPLDYASRPPVPGIYWQSWSYWKFLRVEHSSEIVIYGVKDKSLQDKILDRINSLKVRKIKVTFYDDSRFISQYDEKGNGGMSRLNTPLLRREILK